MGQATCSSEINLHAAATCGRRPMLRRIIGGQTAKPHSWPWMCSIQRSHNYHICGCAIINRHWIVTAAHCKYAGCSYCSYLSTDYWKTKGL